MREQAPQKFSYSFPRALKLLAITCLPLAIGLMPLATLGAGMSAEQKKKYYTDRGQMIQSKVKPTFQERFFDVMLPTAMSHVLGSPMSPETQEVLTRAVVSKISLELITRGLKADPQNIRENIQKILSWSSRVGVFPAAFTVGLQARYQNGIGGSVGTQFNFYYDQGQFKMSTYNLYGAQAGVAYQAKLQGYVALCFGACFGGYGEGWYFGADSSFTAGLGAGFFIEAGMDFSDLVYGELSGASGIVQAIWETKAIYAGFALDYGIGAGWSGNVYYYKMIQDEVLKRYQKPGANGKTALTQQ